MGRADFLPDQDPQKPAVPSPRLPDSVHSFISPTSSTNDTGTRSSFERSNHNENNGTEPELPKPDPDRELIAACRIGDRQAFNELVRHHKGRVYTIAVRLLEDYHEAEDIAQETFFKAYEGIAAFRGDAKFSTWLYRICYNLCLNYLERKKRNPGHDSLPETLADPVASLPEQLIAQERRGFVQQALACLTPEFREVVVLYYTGQLSYEEIATLQELPIGTVRSRLHRGRQELKERLRPHLQEEE